MKAYKQDSFVNDFRLGIGYEIVHFTTYVNYWMIVLIKY